MYVEPRSVTFDIGKIDTRPDGTTNAWVSASGRIVVEHDEIDEHRRSDAYRVPVDPKTLAALRDLAAAVLSNDQVASDRPVRFDP